MSDDTTTSSDDDFYLDDSDYTDDSEYSTSDEEEDDESEGEFDSEDGFRPPEPDPVPEISVSEPRGAGTSSRSSPSSSQPNFPSTASTSPSTSTTKKPLAVPEKKNPAMTRLSLRASRRLSIRMSKHASQVEARRGSFFWSPNGDCEWFLEAWQDEGSAATEVPPPRQFKPRKLRRFPILGALEYIKLEKPPPDKINHPLHFFASVGDLGNVIKLLKEGMDLNALDPLKRTPLHLAAMEGKTEVVGLLLKQFDVDPDPVDSKGFTPLALAAFEGQGECLRVLLARGKVNETREIQTGRAKRHLPSLSKTEATLQVFYDMTETEAEFAGIVDASGADPDGKVSDALRAAISNVDVNCRVLGPDGTKMSPIEVASQRVGNDEVVTFLLRNHARPTKRLIRKYPEYMLLFRLWQRRGKRERYMTGILKDLKAYCQWLIGYEKVVKRAIRACGGLTDPWERLALEKTASAIEFVGSGYQRLRETVQDLAPAISLWTASPSAESTEVDDWTRHWFHQKNFLHALRTIVPIDAVKQYAGTIQSFERLMNSGRHDGPRTLIERLESNRTLSPEDRLHNVLFKVVDRLAKTRDVLKAILVKTDVVLDLEYYEETKLATEMFTECADEVAKSLQEARERFAQEATLKSAVTLLQRSYKSTLPKLLGRAASASVSEVLCFGRKSELSYIDMVDVFITDDRHQGGSRKRRRRPLKRTGECDIVLFPTTLAIGSNRQICRYGTTRTKIVFVWRSESFRITVYGGADHTTILMAREISTPKFLPRRWYEKVRALGHSFDLSLVDDGAKPRLSHKWLHLPHFDDDELVGSFLSV